MFETFLEEHDIGFNSCHHFCSDLPYCDTDIDLHHGIDFRHIYGIQAMVMQSAEDADKIIQAFKYAIQEGYNPELVEQDIYEQLNINPETLSQFDKDRITEEVSDYYMKY